MTRSLSIIRDLLLGRSVPAGDLAEYNAALIEQMPMREAAILKGFTDAQWEAVGAFCKRNGFLWHRDDIAAPVDILPDVLRIITAKGAT